MKKPQVPENDPDGAKAPGTEWRNLRDAKGRLYGRIDRVRLLLELRSHNGAHETVVFELKQFIEIREPETKVVK